MRKVFTVFLALLLAVCLLPLPAVAEDASAGGRYPYVFVHGMMGWGAYDGVESLSPYWGGVHGDMLEDLRSQGYECYSASVGKISSIWDRTCELYAQLTGTRVDYGAAHSEKYGHERFGRTYEGNALMEGWGETGEDGEIRKINLFGHSMGGPTVRMLAYLMAYGSPEEVEASGEDVSELFTGGKADWIYSITTWSAPHNGSPVSNILYDDLPTAYLLAFLGNVLGSGPKADFWDYQLEQFGLTSVKSEGIKAHINFRGISRFVKSDDNCGYDLSLRGAKAMNEWMDIVPSIYYFSYTGEADTQLKNGRYMPKTSISPVLWASGLILGSISGKEFDGMTLGEEWLRNDGMVPVISARAPFDEPVVDYTDGDTVESGVWNFMPVIDGMSHVGYMGMDNDTYQQYYEYQMKLIEGLVISGQ